jgi:hypothetical protein
VRNKLKYYFTGIGVGLSVLTNALLGGFHYEPLSSTSYRLGKRTKIGKIIVKLIDSLFGKDHCLMAHVKYILSDANRPFK